MKRKTNYFALLIAMILPVFAAAQSNKSWPQNVTVVESKRNEPVTVEGDLANGKTIEDLSWAWNSANACFVSMQATKFGGNHVLYATVIPSRSIMTVKVIPEDTNANFSLYAYSISTSDFSIVPDLSRCVTCEADYKWDRPWKGKTQDHTRWIELNAIGDPFNVVIGVAAPKGVTTGKFKLEISIKS